MNKRMEGNKAVYTFNGISDMLKYIEETPRTNSYARDPHSMWSGSERKKFTGTRTYKEAEDLLLHGWDAEAQKIEKQLKGIKKINARVQQKTKMCYGMQGFQACVPRYIQGVPDSMISKKMVTAKQKVINIVKSGAYNSDYTKKQIEEESLKVLECISNIEASGKRVNLSISYGVYNSKMRKTAVFVLKLKSSAQRMNIKQIAFPLVHPSMFRRMIFQLIERADETKGMCHTGYGSSVQDSSVFKDCYYFPAELEEDKITDIEKYRVK